MITLPCHARRQIKSLQGCWLARTSWLATEALPWHLKNVTSQGILAHFCRLRRIGPSNTAGHPSGAVCNWGTQIAARLTCKPSDVSMETR